MTTQQQIEILDYIVEQEAEGRTFDGAHGKKFGFAFKENMFTVGITEPCKFLWEDRHSASFAGKIKGRTIIFYEKY